MTLRLSSLSKFFTTCAAFLTICALNGTVYADEHQQTTQTDTITAAEAGDISSRVSKVPADRRARWHTNMERAQEEAESLDLPILVFFTGSKWCPYCKTLSKAVFNKKEFSEFANRELVLLMLDFQPGGKSRRRADMKLKEEFNVKSFPTYFLTDSKGKNAIKGNTSSNESNKNPENFAAWVQAHKPKL